MTSTLAMKKLSLSTPFIVFGTCLFAFVVLCISRVFSLYGSDQLTSTSVILLSICVWGVLTYLTRTRLVFFRAFWISCASFILAFYLLLFGSAMVSERQPVKAANEDSIISETSRKVEYVYRRPLLIFCFYRGICSSAFSKVRDTESVFRTKSVPIGVLLLGISLPMAFIVSLYYYWRPINQDS